MDRKYSVSEIDRMRRAIEWSYPSGVAYSPQERSAEIENRLRTYMQNGTDPVELEKRAQQRQNAEIAYQQRRTEGKPNAKTE